MAVNLQKGQKIDLTKGNPGLKHVMVGLGWDEVKKGGLLGGLFGGGQDIDCDASAIIITESINKLAGKSDLVYFGNLTHKSGAIKHMGDNLTGAGEGDDEQIFVDLASVPAEYSKIIFVVNIYEAKARRQDFGMINNAFIRIVDSDSKQELCRYNLSENYNGMTSMIFGELYRHNSEWKFSAVGQATADDGLGALVKRYN
ncbi:MAG: TerD family protein [Oscillospiraceae bacterium]|nr:TerD family protein [Oscillospiraceae bacterium]